MQCEIQIYVICIFKFIVKCTNSQNNCYGKISKLELAIIVNSQTQMMFHPFLLPFSLHSSLLPLTSDLPLPLATKSSQTQNNKIQIEKIYSKPLPHRNPQTPHDKSTLYRNPPPPPLTTKPKKKKNPNKCYNGYDQVAHIPPSMYWAPVIESGVKERRCL